LKIGDFAPMESVDPKFHLAGVAPTNHSTSQKTRLNVLSYGIKIWTDLSSVLLQSTRVTDRQTDGRTNRILITIPRLHYMQRGKNSKYKCKNNVYKNGYRRRSCTSKTAKIHRFVRFVSSLSRMLLAV